MELGEAKGHVEDGLKLKKKAEAEAATLRNERDLDRQAFALTNKRKENLLKKLVETKAKLLEQNVDGVADPPVVNNQPPVMITVAEMKKGRLAIDDKAALDAEVKAALEKTGGKPQQGAMRPATAGSTAGGKRGNKAEQEVDMKLKDIQRLIDAAILDKTPLMDKAGYEALRADYDEIDAKLTAQAGLREETSQFKAQILLLQKEIAEKTKEIEQLSNDNASLKQNLTKSQQYTTQAKGVTCELVVLVD